MRLTQSDWIVSTGLRAVEADSEMTAMPDTVLGDPRLSLIAKGLYAILLSRSGQPLNPYKDAIEDPAEISVAIEELIAAGQAVRVER